MARRFRVPRRIVKEDTYGSEPVGAAGLAQLQRYNVMEYSGGAGGGFAHYGMKGLPELSFMGFVASPQTFQGQVQMGKTTGIAVQAYPALPSDSAPPAVVEWLPDWTQTLGAS